MASFIVPVLLLLSSCVPVSATCAHGTQLQARAEPGAKFGYIGEIGPWHWTSLNVTANRKCSEGTNQSPINVNAQSTKLVPFNSLGIKLSDFTEGAELLNLGTTVEVAAPAGNNITIDGTEYELAQFHFHSPSEHMEDGSYNLMEMHMVHQSADARLAVIGLYIDFANPTSSQDGGESDDSSKRSHARNLNLRQEGDIKATLLETVFAKIGEIAEPDTSTHTAPLPMSRLAASLAGTNLHSYSGSLTTPPCAEGVSWFVSTEKLTISLETYRKVHPVLGFNQRPLQNAPGQPNVFEGVCSNSTH